MKDKENHKKMLLDIVNRDYINCEKVIYQDGKQCDRVAILDNEPVGDGRIELFLTPFNNNGFLELNIEDDHCLYINSFKSKHLLYQNNHFDSFLKENFTIYDNETSIEMVKEYVSKISNFIHEFPSHNIGKRAIEQRNIINNINHCLKLWTVRKFISSTEIQVEYNICLSLKGTKWNSTYSNHVFGISIENGIITKDFKNKNNPLSYFSIDDLVYKTFFTLHPRMDNFENNTFNTANSVFTKEVYDRMVFVDKMYSI
jgi:hypothetical protein